MSVEQFREQLRPLWRPTSLADNCYGYIKTQADKEGNISGVSVDEFAIDQVAPCVNAHKIMERELHILYCALEDRRVPELEDFRPYMSLLMDSRKEYQGDRYPDSEIQHQVIQLLDNTIPSRVSQEELQELFIRGLHLVDSGALSGPVDYVDNTYVGVRYRVGAMLGDGTPFCDHPDSFAEVKKAIRSGSPDELRRTPKARARHIS